MKSNPDWMWSGVEPLPSVDHVIKVAKKLSKVIIDEDNIYTSIMCAMSKLGTFDHGLYKRAIRRAKALLGKAQSSASQKAIVEIEEAINEHVHTLGNN